MKKIYIIDAVNVLFRSYYAIRGMTNAKGESTNGLYGFIRSVQKIIKDFSPEYLIAVFDGPQSKEKRTKIYSEYKSHRAKMPDDLFVQLERALLFCEYAHIPFLAVAGVEADDTIGSITRWAEKKGSEVYICSSDKDLCQLVSPHVFILQPHKDNLLVDQQGVKELFGVTPEQIVDLLAIVGDASDNIPGIEGFGSKTAVQLLNEFGTLDAILAHPEKVSGEKKQQTLREKKEIALLSRTLATLDLTVEFPEKEDFFKLKSPNLEKLKPFYQEMGFLSLLKDLGGEAPPAQEEECCYTLVNDEKAFTELMQELSQKKEICIDTETTDIHPLRAGLVGIGFSCAPKKAWYVPVNGKIFKQDVLDGIRPLLENPAISFFGHNIKYDLHVLENAGIRVQSLSFDTLLASYLLAPHNARHNLDELALSNFGKVKIPIESLIGKGKNQLNMADVPVDKVAEYCAEDVDYTLRLKRLFEKELEKQELTSILEKIELPLLPVLLRMERRGVFVNIEKLKMLSEELSQNIEALVKEIYLLAGETFNISSPKQLSKILFEKMGIKPLKKTTTGFSTSAEVLEALQDEVPLVRLILEFRTLEKLRSTYVDALPGQINPSTGRIHCTFNQSIAATGRLSSQNPNLQNIPIRTQEGKRIREAFEPQLEGWSFVSADYSQIELRLLAHLSEDPGLIRAFEEGEDVHAYTASLVFNVPLKEVSSDMRRKAKAVNFGIIYGQQAFGLSEGLGIDYHEASGFIETYFQRYKKVKDFLEFCKESARKTGYTLTMTGRKRPIPEIANKNPLIRAQAERFAINTPLQGSAADLIKLAMIELDALLLQRRDLGFMVLQIHDELIFETPDHQVDEMARHAKKIMEGTFKLKVPLIVDISIGKNWGVC